MDRARRLLRSLTKEARIVEIGPSFSPLAPKRDGWDTVTVDHASREELLVKYADQDTARIEAVDHVWRGGPLAEAIPAEQHGSFDAFVASHVIEHAPDIVTFLRAAETLLKPDGVVILAVPDKRKCFDFYRPLSATADAVSAFHERRDRHSLRTQIDYALGMAHKPGGEGAWFGADTRPVTPVSSLADEPSWREAAGSPDYVDAHAWVFVPSSFELMIVELAALGYLDLRVDEVAEADPTEFHAWLRPGRAVLPPDGMQARRRSLMERSVLELADQSRQIEGSPLNALGHEPALAEARGRLEQDLEGRLAESEARGAAVRTVLSAVRASTGRFGLDRRAFKAAVARAARSIPSTGPAAVQHQVLLDEARAVLGIEGGPDGIGLDRA